MRINESYKEMFPNNCPVIEVDGDGKEVGICTYYLKDGYCQRHGLIIENNYTKSEDKFVVSVVYDNDWKLRFWADLRSHYKSICIGWFVIVWSFDDFDKCIQIDFMPTYKTLFDWRKNK